MPITVDGAHPCKSIWPSGYLSFSLQAFSALHARQYKPDPLGVLGPFDILLTVLLMRAIDHLYRQAGLYEGKPKGYPTMADVRDYLIAYKAKGREAGWMESAMRAVEVLCFGEMGTVLNNSRPLDLAKLLDRRVILELDALTNADKTFLIESLLLWIHHYRMGQGQREDCKHGIIIEEAHHILLRKKQEVTGEETVTDVLLREIRELGGLRGRYQRRRDQGLRLGASRRRYRVGQPIYEHNRDGEPRCARLRRPR